MATSTEIARENMLAALSAHAIRRDSLPLPKLGTKPAHPSWCMCAFCAAKEK